MLDHGTLSNLSLGIGVETKTLLLIFHLVSISIGVGSSTLADILIARKYLWDRVICREDFAVIAFASRVVSLGLCLAWLSGGLYFFYHLSDNPNALENPRFLAKLSIVGILTLNGLFIHSFIIPRFKAQIGGIVLDGINRHQGALFLISGCVSLVSWYYLILLGVAREFNHVVPFWNIMLLYSILVVSVFLLISGIKPCIKRFAYAL